MSRNSAVDRLISVALEEDVGPGDWTTLWTVEEGTSGRAVIVAKESLVVAGTDPALRVFRKVDPGLELAVVAEDGTRIEEEDPVLEIEGSLRSILTAERTAMNFLGRLSGIATLTRRFVDAVAGSGARILDTRKTTPGWRILEKEAVLAGGGDNHRMGLYDMVMVKDNHLVAAGGIRASVARVDEANHLGLEVEVEVGSLEELEEALSLGVRKILLDNMSTEAMREAVARVAEVGENRPLLEASGNVTLERVGEIADTGVDFISVGALTHSAPAADLSLRVLRG